MLQIEEARRQLSDILLAAKQQFVVTCDAKKLTIADAHSPNYFSLITNFAEVKTITLADHLNDIRKYMRNSYYHYVSNDCDLLEKKSKYGNHFGRRYGAECQSNITRNGHLLSGVAFGVGLPDGVQVQNDGRHIVTFIHLIPYAISFDNGDVIHGNMKIVPQKCGRNLKKVCPKRKQTLRKHREVFTIAQYWGNGFYHGTLEDLPRIAPYLSFLRRHPEIKIHVKGKPKYLSLLGIDDSRLIRNPAVEAEILYMPAGGTCGRSSLFTTQVLANALATSQGDASPKIRDTIVLIKRSRTRWFGQHDAILRMIEKHASRVNLSVEVFADNPLPSINKTIEMFRRAEVVIAPHGAGESNLLFSQPGTLLIEGLCYGSDRMANLCYRNMAQALGLRYYGLIYRHQCTKITDKQVERPLLEYLNLKFKYRP